MRETRGELRRLALAREQAAKSEHDGGATEDPTHSELKNDQLLRLAQQSYLRGDWVAAEQSLRQAIRSDRDDFESRLWLVSVLRAAGRTDQAGRVLDRVATRDAARGWRREIEQERRRLQRLVNQTTDPQSESPPPPEAIDPQHPERHAA
ncbi:tetratricopeptide repeat protein [Botrimarina sp.]|uniref:tetratricopeptide repeat protein n=1 Tax=Botrimarina sp. TaxID=2795802 RepID=UPI0032EBE7E2